MREAHAALPPRPSLAVSACRTTSFLAFSTSGSPRAGARLVVRNQPEFLVDSDHWPVTLELPAATFAAPATGSNSGRHARHRGSTRRNIQQRWVWDSCLRDRYVQALQQGEAAGSLDQMMQHDPHDALTLLGLLKGAACAAAAAVGMPQRPLLPRATAPKARPCSAATALWYGPACHTAYKRLKSAWAARTAALRPGSPASGFGQPDGAAARQAVRSYKLAVRRAKRRHTKERQAYLADLLANKPQDFWRLAKKGAKAATGLSKAAWHDYFQAMRNPTRPAVPADAPATNGPSPPLVQAQAPHHPHDATLDVPFSETEVAAAVQHVKTGRTADAYGDIVELFTCNSPSGQPYLLPHLSRVLNAIFASGQYPTPESAGMIITLYKGKGSEADGGNYRGITIITAISKIYATLLNQRLTPWRLRERHRHARGQGGFLPDFRTADHIFLLQHTISKYCSIPATGNGRRLYTCFVDLSKAFDTISRPKLWERLRNLGIGGRMLSALQAYYAEVRECVKTPEGLTDTFSSHLGVKQGCPLSPTLFGLYIDALEEYMLTALPGSTVRVGMERLLLLLYADDIVFMATSEAELQSMMDTFSDFCAKYELTVNLGKTKVVVFGNQRGANAANIVYRGRVVEQAEEYKYLGVTFHCKRGVMKGGEAMLAVARSALFAMMRQAKAEDIADPIILCRMFDTLVAPILLYGSEAWGFNNALVEGANRLHMGFLKRLLGVPVSTDTWVVLTELGRTPMAHRILERQCAFWNRLVQVRVPRLLAHAARESVAWMVGGRKGWFLSTKKSLNMAGVQISLETICVGGGMVIPLHTLRAKLKVEGHGILASAVSCGVRDDRDLYGSNLYSRAEGYMKRSYALWFWGHGGCSPAMRVRNPAARRQLLRFRMGVHNLCVVAGARERAEKVPRGDRVCRCCSMGVVEDEVHMVFECPRYQIIRMGFINLFRDDLLKGVAENVIVLGDTTDMMRRFFAQQDQLHVAMFVSSCLKGRADFLESMCEHRQL
jgi:hypothetical protein